MAHSNIGKLLAKMLEHDKAITCFQRALDIDPNFEFAAASLLHSFQHVCDWSGYSKLEPKVRDLTKKSIREGSKIGDTPFAHMSRCAEPSENYEIAQAKSREIAERASMLKKNFSLNEARARSSKITLGYLSASYCNHPTAHIMLGLFGLHDHLNFNVFTFSYGLNDDSIYRRKIERDSDRFFDIREIGYLEAARQINESGVDILIDLNGHTRNTRLEICALRPSPVQITYMGFPGTSGADFFDYILTDRIVTPESEARHFSERLVFLPNTYWVNDHTQEISDEVFKRADFGLPETSFVFCLSTPE